MTLSAFANPAQPPSPDELGITLGPAADLWASLLQDARSAYAPLSELWNHSGASVGWSLRLKQRERVILYLTPQRGAFLVGLVLGERAAQDAEAAPLPPRALAAVTAAPRYAEGRGIRLTVASPADLLAVQSLLPFKRLARAPRVSHKPVTRQKPVTRERRS